MSNDDFEIQYLGNNTDNFFKMLFDIIEANFLSLSENEICTIKNEIHKYQADNSSIVSNISKTIYNKFNNKRYYGIQPPENLPFFSFLDVELADRISDLLLEYVCIKAQNRIQYFILPTSPGKRT